MPMTPSVPILCQRIRVTGVVQGVGFRPFVYGMARRLGLVGWVRNTSAGVLIELQGPAEAVDHFLRALRAEAPPLARIEGVQIEPCAPNGLTTFEILDSETSEAAGAVFQPVPPDVAICDDCLRELFDPTNRRYRYPFINCTQCGPRFTIIRAMPYDRPRTTMSGFAMCPDCAREYHDPADRRFHAQPIACPTCGPQVWLESGAGEALTLRGDAAIREARRRLRDGQIVAVKGLGGFHLACLATSSAAVAELRRRKQRPDKPFALMMPDLAAVAAHCHLSEAERETLTSRERPILILDRRADSTLAAEVAPGQATLGVMLPYTPLHHLLLAKGSDGDMPPLVMTSGNLSEEPIAAANDEARARLAGLADAFLMHDRDIHIRCDDSVLRVFADRPVFIRRARGFAPGAIPLPARPNAPPTLAAGGELKNAFCLTRDDRAFLSQHIGDLENYETLQAYESGIAHFEALFQAQPRLLAYDLHPNYLATRYALARAERDGLPAVGVQHHHAHIAACMAEHGLPGDLPAIGVAFDGTGYGTDGAIWGGEFLIAGYRGFERAAHLAYVPLPGGDLAARQPYRMALSHLARAGIAWADDLPPVAACDSALRAAIRRQIESGLNAPPTSSMGRLFDAVAALIGIRQTAHYEAQPAIELEASVDPGEMGAYPFDLNGAASSVVIDPAPALRAVIADWRAGLPVGRIAARFHNGVAEMVGAVCRGIRARAGLTRVALSGGVWQNMRLLARTVARLQADGFAVYAHRQVPTNDGGLALGQAVVAVYSTSTRSSEPLSRGGETGRGERVDQVDP